MFYVAQNEVYNLDESNSRALMKSGELRMHAYLSQMLIGLNKDHYHSPALRLVSHRTPNFSDICIYTRVNFMEDVPHRSALTAINCWRFLKV